MQLVFGFIEGARRRLRGAVGRAGGHRNPSKRSNAFRLPAEIPFERTLDDLHGPEKIGERTAELVAADGVGPHAPGAISARRCRPMPRATPG